MWRKRNPFTVLLVRMQTGAATLENRMELPQKVKNRTTLWSSNCTTRYLPKEYRNTNSNGYMHLMFIVALSRIAKVWKEPKSPTIDEWTKKMWYINTMEYYLAIKKEWSLAICNDLDGATWYYTKQNKSVRERQIPYDFTHMWNLGTKENWTKKKRDKKNRRLTIENKPMIPRGQVGGGMGETGEGD